MFLAYLTEGVKDHNLHGMRKYISILLVMLPLIAFGQRQHSNDIFPKFGDYERKGWIVSPMGTFTIGSLKENSTRLWAGSDSVYDVSFDQQNRFGFGIEVGRFYAIDNSPLISFVDFTIGWKVLDGGETFEAIRDVPENGTPHSFTGGGSFNHSYVTASFNASNTKGLGSGVFLKNTLGINGDYRVTDNSEYDFGGLPGTLNSPTRFIFQAHYSFGIGFAINQRVLLVPSLETPIVTFYEFDDLKSTLNIFNSRFRPILFRLNVMILDKRADRKCPKNKGSRKGIETLFGSAGSRPW